MKSYPLPHTEFLERMKTGDLPGLKCLDCNGYVIPPNAVCPECGSLKLARHSFSKKGILRTFTIVRVGPAGFHAMSGETAGAWFTTLVDIVFLGCICAVLAFGAPKIMKRHSRRHRKSNKYNSGVDSGTDLSDSDSASEVESGQSM